MLLRMLVGMMALACAAVVNGQPDPPNQSVDFRNFTFPFPAEKRLAVPGKMAWMSRNVSTTVTLRNGRHDFDKTDPSAGPSLTLDRVLYGHLASAKQLDAVAVLRYHSGGTAYWEYVYAFSLASGSPKLVAWLRTGSRADFGLYRVEIAKGGLILDLFDPDRRLADCCSEGFVRTRYTFRNEYLVQNGPDEFGPVLESKPRPVNKPDR